MTFASGMIPLFQWTRQRWCGDMSPLPSFSPALPVLRPSFSFHDDRRQACSPNSVERCTMIHHIQPDRTSRVPPSILSISGDDAHTQFSISPTFLPPHKVMIAHPNAIVKKDKMKKKEMDVRLCIYFLMEIKSLGMKTKTWKG